ncbi:MAG: hypothetical protein B0A82_23670 [Alkalinema sp. CACIAM 70d]|nr:MAG: hypothetical protein B0A82_23670 [Alkalinema sp. CACIAM 70d]
MGDRQLRSQLDRSLTQCFQAQCDPTSLQILNSCEWSITTTANVAMLVIICPNRKTNWQVLNQAVPLSNTIAQFSQDAKLRIYSTPKMLDYFEIRVDEISIYQESV